MEATRSDLEACYGRLESEELVELYKKRELTELAISVLEEELEKRGISTEEMETIHQEEQEAFSQQNLTKPEELELEGIERLCCQYHLRSMLFWRAFATQIDHLILSPLLLLFIKLDFQIAAVLMILSVSAYYIISEWKFGKTVGKHIIRIRVVNINGENPSLGQAIFRTLARVLEVNPFAFKGILSGWPAIIIISMSSKKQRLGDMISQTYVVREVDAKSKSFNSDYKSYTFRAS